MLDLDSHILVHALKGDLRRRERELPADDGWVVAAIVHRELAKLVQPGRIDLDLDDREVIAATSVVHRVPLLTRDRRMLRSKAVPLAR